MAPQIPTCEPQIANAGSTWQWTKALDDFPPSEGWALTYYFVGRSSFSVVAAPQTSDYLVTVSSTVSNVPAGAYRWVARAVLNGVTWDAATGVLEVLANPNVQAASDQRTHAEKMLVALEAEIEARVTGNGSANTGYSIGGRSINKFTLDELYKHRAKYRAEVARLKRGGRTATIGMRFGRAG